MGSQSSGLITISILTYNRANVLCSLLDQLISLKYNPLEIIVVDNHSTDGTDIMIKDKYPTINHIRTDKNIGVLARNIGMKQAKGDIIITLDDDILDLLDEHLLKIMSIFLERPRLGALNFKIHDLQGKICCWAHHCTEEDNHDKEFLTYEITEGAVAFRKTCLEQSGYYPKNFFISHEGPDLAFRIFESGFEVIYSNEVQVTHQYSDHARVSWRNYYYDTRNQFWLAARNYPLYYSIRYLARGLISMMIYSIRDGYFLYWLKAIKDAIFGLREAMKERKVLSSHTMNIIKRIDSRRPDILYILKKRLFSKGMRF
ncbi:MAG TPA: glycosyltransferase [Bacteroidales bacterium]|nr:glycosyltransferase [Bacteroidales bacterium]